MVRIDKNRGRFAIRRASAFVALLAALCFSATVAWAQCPGGSTCWVGGASGVWSNSANWSNGVPTSSTNALINNGKGVSAVTLDVGGAQALGLTVNNADSLNFNDSTNLTVSG